MHTAKRLAAAAGFAAVLAAVVLPAAAFAQGVTYLLGSGGDTKPVTGTLYTSAPAGQTGSEDPKAANFQLIPCTGVQIAGDAKNTAACDFNAVIITINRFLRLALYLAIPLTTGMILYTGWLYVSANGETGQLEKAKKMFVPVLLGLFWIGASYIVIYTVIDKFVSKDLSQSTKDAIQVFSNTK